MILCFFDVENNTSKRIDFLKKQNFNINIKPELLEIISNEKDVEVHINIENEGVSSFLCKFIFTFFSSRDNFLKFYLTIPSKSFGSIPFTNCLFFLFPHFLSNCVILSYFKTITISIYIICGFSSVVFVKSKLPTSQHKNAPLIK